MQYAITLDIDGTILNRDGQLSKYTKEIIERLKIDGHLIMLATGRPLSGALPVYQALNLDTPVITDNGSCIDHPLDRDFASQRTYMSIDIMHALFKHVKPYLKTAFFNVENTVYAYQYDKKLERIFSGLSQEFVIEKDFDQIDERPTGLIFLMDPLYKSHLESFITAHYSQKIAYRLWGEDGQYAVYEIYLKHVSKASAIKYVLGMYDIPIERWISFGDGINDIEMIIEAGHGVVMKNAHHDLMKYASHITTYDNHQNGVAKYLAKYFLIK